MSVAGPAFQGELVSIADGRATFLVAGQQGKDSENKVIALGQLVRWGNPVAAKPQAIVVLADGGQIVAAADWAGGDVVKLADDEVVVQSDLLHELRFPRAAVSGIVFALQRRVGDREKLVDEVRDERFLATATPERPGRSLQGREIAREDLVMLANGDRASGTISELANRALVVKIAGQPAKLPLGRVEAIGFSTPKSGGSSSVRPPPPRLVVGLRDGSMIYAKTIRATDAASEIELGDGAKFKDANAADIVAIESISDGVVFLSDIAGADYRHVPYLSLKWTYTRDRNVVGGAIVVGGKRYWKGIGMHSAARLTYTLDREYRRFDSAVAVDDSANGRGSVVFGVYVNRDGKWTEAYKSETVRGGEKPLPVSIDLRGAKGLTLTVDFADRGDELDHAVWLDARLVK